MSSPSDVEFERQRVDWVAERLNDIFMDIARIETFRWEKSFYSAHQSYQPQIDEAQKLTDCEIVIATSISSAACRWWNAAGPCKDQTGTAP